MGKRLNYDYRDEAEAVKFYKAAKPSPELQARLDVMKGWDAKRLAAAVPAWAKPTMPPATFKPQLSQKFPSWTYADTSCKCTRTAKDFAGLRADMPIADYIALWERRMNLKPTWPFA